jgi:hypothetical protein
MVKARAAGSSVELEFVSAAEGENLEETPDLADDREISFRQQRHYASSVRHRKYHGVDVVSAAVAKVE